jgi:hypothetical protein
MNANDTFTVGKFRQGGPDYVPALQNVYLYDLVISVLSIAGGVLICL